MPIFTSLIAGLTFGLGLIWSGMSNPAKVLGFLDLTGAWDPSLSFVMAGAVSVSYFAFRLAGKRTKSLLGSENIFPTAMYIDRRLLIGSALFGIGWGIAGFCPGPGLVGLGSGGTNALTFVAAMLFGMAVFEFINKRRQTLQSATR